MNTMAFTNNIIKSKYFLIILQSVLEMLPVSSSSFINLISPYSKGLHLYSGLSLSMVMSKEIVEIMLNTRYIIFYVLTTITSVLCILIFNESIPPLSTYVINIISGSILLFSIIESRNEQFSYSIFHSLAIGYLQSIAALLPGSSRLGVVLIWLFMHGINFQKSLEIGCILGIPLNMAACIYEKNLSWSIDLFFICLLFTWIMKIVLNNMDKKHLYTIVFIRIMTMFVIYLF